MKFKKLSALLTVGALASVSMLAGCGSTDDGTTTSDTSTNSDAKYTIGLCQTVQHDALDAATNGFQDKLKELLGDDVSFNLQNAAGDSATCSTIANQFVSSGVDLIFANATAALQAAAAATDTIPIVGTSITDYGTALDITDWTGTTGRNITGSSDLAPLEQQAAMFKELLPDAQNIGLVYCSSESNSKYQVDIVQSELEALGYTCTQYSFADSNDIVSIITSACDASDALYIPTDNTAAANTEIINNVALPAGVPIIAGEEGICEGCGIATLSIDYYSLGEKAGEMAYEILVNGADPSTMEIEYADGLTKKYVADRCEQLGITVPDDYVEITAE